MALAPSGNLWNQEVHPMPIRWMDSESLESPECFNEGNLLCVCVFLNCIVFFIHPLYFIFWLESALLPSTVVPEGVKVAVVHGIFSMVISF